MSQFPGPTHTDPNYIKRKWIITNDPSPDHLKCRILDDAALFPTITRPPARDRVTDAVTIELTLEVTYPWIIIRDIRTVRINYFVPSKPSKSNALLNELNHLLAITTQECDALEEQIVYTTNQIKVATSKLNDCKYPPVKEGPVREAILPVREAQRLSRTRTLEDNAIITVRGAIKGAIKGPTETAIPVKDPCKELQVVLDNLNNTLSTLQEQLKECKEKESDIQEQIEAIGDLQQFESITYVK